MFNKKLILENAMRFGFINEETYYHGTSSMLAKEIGHKLLPPQETNRIQEFGRKKNLDKVFFTKDIGSAKIYAQRACNTFGGEPVLFRVIPMGRIECLNDVKGTTVCMSDWAFAEKLH